MYPGSRMFATGPWKRLRLVEHIDEKAHFEPASIPAYTKDGFERVQKLKLTPDEAQFASQFNGTRSVQQIAKNLRLDLKSARQMLFRFVALEIVECWPASTAAKPEQQSIFQRFGRKVATRPLTLPNASGPSLMKRKVLARRCRRHIRKTAEVVSR